MLSEKDYIRLSLEANLFFLRIAKEHAIFAAASLPPIAHAAAGKMLLIKNSLEELLSEAVEMADRMISHEVLASDELITDFTLAAEMKTQLLMGIPINTELTRRELEIRAEKKGRHTEELQEEISELNKKAAALTKSAIAYKAALLKNIRACKVFSYTYPSMLDHIIEEEEYYVALLQKLEKRDIVDSVKEIIEEELNWNHLMEEHSEFIRGYLDPKEEKLFRKADSFACEFDKLVEKTEMARDNTGMLPEVTRESLKKVAELRDFKGQGTMGLLKCEIEALISPLLSDHVLREANRYLRLLKAFEKQVR